MRVKRNTLLLLACLVWGAAGFNILRIGAAAYPGRLVSCQVKCNRILKKISRGERQSRHLRGRRFNRATR